MSRDKNVGGCFSAKETIGSGLREAIRNRKERNAKDRAERRESRFRSATREEIDHLSWRIAIKTGPDPGSYASLRASRFTTLTSCNNADTQEYNVAED